MKQASFKIGSLIFARNLQREFLMMRRAREPNAGKWSVVGGKLEMDQGESPHACAVREMHEETGFLVNTQDLHLFGIITEANYQEGQHWMLFLFDCKRPINYLPPSISEGNFAFFSREALHQIDLPWNDGESVWKLYDAYHRGFVAAAASFSKPNSFSLTIEETIKNSISLEGN